MSISSHRTPTGPAQVLVEVVASVRDLADTLWSARSDDDLVETVLQVRALRSALAAVEAGALVEADVRDMAKRQLH
jgi:hypothetical protein